MTKILLMGRKQIAANVLEYLHQHESYELVGVLTDNHLHGSITTAKANELGVKIYEFNQAVVAIRNKELIFDLGLSVLYWRKLTKEFYESPKFGAINFHPAPLPQYKGTAGYNLAILNDLVEWGITAHYIDKEIDAGEIISVEYFYMDSKHETAQSLEKKTVQKLEGMVYQTCKEVLQNKGRLKTIPNIGGKYVSRAEMEAMKEIVEGDDIDRKIRAFWFPPYDGAYTVINGERYTLINREILAKLAPSGTTSLFAQQTNEGD